jgi:hypothetical protein
VGKSCPPRVSPSGTMTQMGHRVSGSVRPRPGHAGEHKVGVQSIDVFWCVPHWVHCNIKTPSDHNLEVLEFEETFRVLPVRSCR